MTAAASLTIGELEAGYPQYCKALRILLKEGASLNRIQRTVCWSRLTSLHACLPGRYKSPDYLCLLLKREIKQKASEAAASSAANKASGRPIDQHR
jgi:hypothetical protein